MAVEAGGRAMEPVCQGAGGSAQGLMAKKNPPPGGGGGVERFAAARCSEGTSLA
ncbi:MAG: hypothetical protein ACK583_09350 [Cyanobacteriota bacterium]